MRRVSKKARRKKSVAYKGDIDAKRLARYGYWRAVRGWMQDDFTTKRHLVLASEYAGDVATLLGMNVPDENIVAVDLDRNAVAECSDRFPFVEVIRGDVADVIRSRPRGFFGSIFLDFCSWFTKSAGECLVTAAKSIEPGGVVGIGVMRGRETSTFMARKNRLHERLAPLAPHHSRPRGAMIYETLQGGLVGVRRLALGVHAGEYQSGRTPMLYRAYGISSLGPISRKSFMKRSGKLVHEVIRLRIEAMEARDAAFGKMVGQMPDFDPVIAVEIAGKVRHLEIGVVQSHNDRGGCVDMATLAERDGDNPALCLNVSSRTLGAWRAHDSMGTYGGEPFKPLPPNIVTVIGEDGSLVGDVDQSPPEVEEEYESIVSRIRRRLGI